MFGLVYKIIHNQSNICYVGSTFNNLKNRWQMHKNYKSNKTECSIVKYFEKYGIENFKIILIKKYEVYDRKQLLALEQLWINKLKSININKAFQPLNNERDKQLRILNKEKKREYNNLNKDKIKEYQKNYYNENKEEVLKKNKINSKIRIICNCGIEINKGEKSKHIKTKKHINLLQSLK